jgi:lysophospholipase L1-like esterase
MTAYRRFVAIGDSTTEGVGDPLPDGTLRGWADRFADALAARQDGLAYANLAVGGRRTQQVLAEQLEPALALSPDLVAAVVGMNDLVARRLDCGALRADVGQLFARLRAAGARVLTATLPDLSRLLPLPSHARGRLSGRVVAVNRVLSSCAEANGCDLLALHALPLALDRRLWRPDRLHPNAVGHEVLAEAFLQLLDVGDAELVADDREGLGVIPWARPGAVAASAWMTQVLVPKLVRSVLGRGSSTILHPRAAHFQRRY